MYVQTYRLITLVNRRDNFHHVSKSIDCKLCNYLPYVDICINNSLYKINIVHNTQLIFMSSFLLSLCQCICFQHICYPFCSSVTCIFCIFSVIKQCRKHLDTNTQVNKLEMTLKLLTTHRIVSVSENNHVVIG